MFVRPAAACSLVALESPTQFVLESEAIVIARVIRAERGEALLQPEAYLKGPVSAGQLHFTADPRGNDGVSCPTAAFRTGDRVLVYLLRDRGSEWPLANAYYRLVDGHARPEYDTGAPPLAEAEAVEQIRALTGQYAVPAASAAEGAGIDWWKTVVPVGGALLVIFAIGLVLMRLWHRIDPS